MWALIVEDIVADFREDIHRTHARVQVGELPAVRGNAIALRHMFSNLLSNALKFASEITTEPRVEFGAAKQAEGWVFFVRDNGPGIHPANRDRLFEPFTRLHRRADVPGAGLGLAICRRCAELHQGRIWIDEQYAEGAQLNVLLPTLDP